MLKKIAQKNKFFCAGPPPPSELHIRIFSFSDSCTPVHDIMFFLGVSSTSQGPQRGPNSAQRNSFFMCYLISLWLVRTCKFTSPYEPYSDLCYPQQKLVAWPGYWTPVSWVWSQDSTTELSCHCWKWGAKLLYIYNTNIFLDILAIEKMQEIK